MTVQRNITNIRTFYICLLKSGWALKDTQVHLIVKMMPAVKCLSFSPHTAKKICFSSSSSSVEYPLLKVTMNKLLSDCSSAHNIDNLILHCANVLQHFGNYAYSLLCRDL